MLSLIRRKLRGEFNFPKNHDRYFGVPAVYSLENVKYPQADGSVCGIRPAMGKDAALKLDCGAGLGAATHITGAFAFAAVSKRSEEHTSELQSLMRISYAVFCLKKQTINSQVITGIDAYHTL